MTANACIRAGLIAFMLVQAAAPAPPGLLDESPGLDSALASAAIRGREMAALDAAARRDTVARMRWLTRRGQHNEALAVFAEIIDRTPERLREAMRAQEELRFEWLRDRGSGRPEKLMALVSRIAAKLPELPRDDAAAVAIRLPRVESDISRIPPERWAQRMRQLASEYAGTREGDMLAADMSAYGTFGAAAADRHEAYARLHPGTVTGAKALFNAAQTLRSNTDPGPNRNPDPTERFMRVLRLVKELESGGWPAIETAESRTSFVTSFFWYKPVFAPGNADKVLNAYVDFIASHFTLSRNHPAASDGVGYGVSSRVPELLEAKGAPLSDIEKVFDRILERAADPDAVRYLRGAVYERWMVERPQRKDEWLPKAREAYASLAAAGSGLYNRKALASLASPHFVDREFGQAAALYQQYLSRFPSSSWSWVAALRLGQSLEQTGDSAGATAAYQRAAASADEPLARVLGAYNAGRLEEGSRRFRDALGSYRAALAAWDDRYGDRANAYTLHTSLRPQPDAPMFPRQPAMKSASPLAKPEFEAHVRRLERQLPVPGGVILAEAQWLLAHERWPEAITAFDRFLDAHGRSDAAAEARHGRRLAQLQHALTLANAGPEAGNLDAVLAQLQLAVRERPWDPATGISRIAEASALFLKNDSAEAEARMRAALDEWREQQRVPPGRSRLQDPLQEDVAEIWRIVFRPAGGDPFSRGGRWNAFEWPAPSALNFLLVQPDIPVMLASGDRHQIHVFRAQPDISNVLFVDREGLRLLQEVLYKLGGTRTRQPQHVMETPNQPIGGSRRILSLWTKFFAARPGHWSGFDLKTLPEITQIDFYDAARTKAGAKVTIGYSGATVLLEKVDGVWRATGLTDQWIT